MTSVHLSVAGRCAIALSFALAACSSAPSQPAATAASPAALAQQPIATAAPSRASISANGELALAVAAISARFETTARVTAVLVKPGQAVRKGDALATVDDTALKDAVTDAQLALDLTEANILAANVPATQEAIDAAKAALNAAYTGYSAALKANDTAIEAARANAASAWNGYLSSQVVRDRACGSTGATETSACKQQEISYGNAFESLMTARANYENALKPIAQSALAQANASIQSSKARLEDLTAGQTETAIKTATLQRSQAQTALDRARANLALATLRSPCDCVVSAVNTAVGAMPSGAAFTLVDLSRLQFKTTNLVERDVAAIQVGAPVTIRLKAWSDALTGSVRAVLAQSPGTQSGTALYTVLIDVNADGRALLPGMTGQVDITTR